MGIFVQVLIWSILAAAIWVLVIIVTGKANIKHEAMGGYLEPMGSHKTDPFIERDTNSCLIIEIKDRNKMNEQETADYARAVCTELVEEADYARAVCTELAERLEDE